MAGYPYTFEEIMGAWSEFWNGPQIREEAPPSDPSTALVIPRRDAAGSEVNDGDALGLIALYRAIQVISTSLMQLSLDAVRGDELITPRPLFVSKPALDISRAAFLEQSGVSLALAGNCFWRVFRDAQGRVTSAFVLNPHDVKITQDDNDRLVSYEYKSKSFTPAEVKHLSLMRVPGSPRGMGPIQAAQAELRGALDTRDYASHWFTEAGVPTGLLSAKMPLTADQAIAAKNRWTETQGGYRGVAVLGGDFSYQPVYLSPADAQFIEGQQFSTTAIARLFGIPAALMLAVVEGGSKTYSNIAQSWAEFQKFTLSRYTVEIESAMSELMPRGTEVRFNLEGLLRPDVVTRYQMHKEALESGWMTKDEVRAIENLPPLPAEATPPAVVPPITEEKKK